MQTSALSDAMVPSRLLISAESATVQFKLYRRAIDHDINQSRARDRVARRPNRHSSCRDHHGLRKAVKVCRAFVAPSDAGDISAALAQVVLGPAWCIRACRDCLPCTGLSPPVARASLLPSRAPLSQEAGRLVPATVSTVSAEIRGSMVYTR